MNFRELLDEAKKFQTSSYAVKNLVDTAMAQTTSGWVDDETAHMYEDEIYTFVLDAIARGECDNPQECAKEALKLKNHDFSRWYA